MAALAEEETDEDPVVREIDVFLCPRADENTKLFLFQYPLRPAWRPYGLEERCQEIRVKEKLARVEVDLVMDTSSVNFNSDAAEHLQIKTQTLTSSHVDLTASYAIGVLRNNKLFLTPLNAAVQLRPSLGHIDRVESERQKKKQRAGEEEDALIDDTEQQQQAAQANGGEEGEEKPELVALEVSIKKKETEQQLQQRLASHAYITEMEEKEPWIPLAAYAADSDEALGLKERLFMAAPDTPIPFPLTPGAYLEAISQCRVDLDALQLLPSDGLGPAGLSRSYLESLPLDRGLHMILSKAKAQVFQFDRLQALLPAEASEEEVLRVLQQKAMLINGCWVPASPLRYSSSPPTCVIRDFILLQFTKSRQLFREQLDALRVPKELVRDILLTLATPKGTGAGWEFMEEADEAFMLRQPIIVQEQARRWQAAEQGIRQAALSLNLPTMPELQAAAAAATAVKGGGRGRGGGMERGMMGRGLAGPAASAGRGAAPGSVPSVAAAGMMKVEGGAAMAASSGSSLMPAEMKAALHEALRIIFGKHSVCNLAFLSQCLREHAITQSAMAKTARATAAAVAVAKAAGAPLAELAAAVTEVATCIDGSFFLSSLRNPSLDAFRQVVIALLKAKGATGGLKRTDIMEAAKIALGSDVSPVIYNRVMKELCVTRGAVWVLKPGDGRPG